MREIAVGLPTVSIPPLSTERISWPVCNWSGRIDRLVCPSSCRDLRVVDIQAGRVSHVDPGMWRQYDTVSAPIAVFELRASLNARCLLGWEVDFVLHNPTEEVIVFEGLFYIRADSGGQSRRAKLGKSRRLFRYALRFALPASRELRSFGL